MWKNRREKRALALSLLGNSCTYTVWVVERKIEVGGVLMTGICTF
jgi:hypothetical protein